MQTITPEFPGDSRLKPFLDSLVAASGTADSVRRVDTRYPFPNTEFPADFVPPTFQWSDSGSGADFWLIEAEPQGGAPRYTLTQCPPAPQPVIDSSAIPMNTPMEIPDPNRFRNWTPSEKFWNGLKGEFRGRKISLIICGFNRSHPLSPLSKGKFAFMISPDSVKAPIFYRDVPIMPVKNESGRIQPLSKSAQRLIRWSLRDVSRAEGKVVIQTLPTCANCHSFSKNGDAMGLDLDGPQDDKGTYGLARISKDMDIAREDVFSWNYDFKDKPKGKKTIGFMSRVSPDGKFVATTVNEEVFIHNYMNNRYIQVFYPTRGVLAYYSKADHRIKKLPGADDTAFVHCDPVWTPDGKYIVFARAPAKDPYVKGQPDPKFPNDSNETQIRYGLYRIPFNGGRGGKAEAIAGAGDNGMSNNFPKVTPDGRFIVFVKCRNGQLLRPDSKLWIVPFAGGEARLMNCNLPDEMNSWHSFSPDGRWMVFSSKGFSYYTQMFLTHVGADGMDTPPVLVPNATAANRAVNLPEFVNIRYDDLNSISVSAVKHMQFMQDAYDWLEKKNPSEAMRNMRRALEVERHDVKFRSEAQVLLGWLQENLDSGVAITRAATRTDPQNPLAQFNLGLLLEKKGRTADAEECYRNSLRLDPSNVWAMVNLARIYLYGDVPKLHDKAKAVELAEKANSASHYREPSIMKTLARAYSELGRFQEAAATAQTGLDLAQEQNLQQEAFELGHETELYRQGKPFSLVLQAPKDAQ